MVETRAQAKSRNGQGHGDNMSEPVASTSAAIAPTNTRPPNASECSRSSSATIRAKKLLLEAQHMRIVAQLEAQVADANRKAADLELEAKLAALESGSARSRTQRSSRSIQSWLDTVVNNNNTPQPTTAQNTTIQHHVAEVECNSNYNNCGGNCSKEPISNVVTTANIPFGGRSSKEPNPLPITATNIPLFPTCFNCGKITKPLNNNIPLLPEQNVVYNNNNNGGTKHRCSDLRLPIFDGKPLDWLALKRMFQDTKDVFSPAENLARIGLCLRGAARETVAVLLVSARDPEEVMNALELRFGRSEIIVLNEITTVRSLPKLNSDTCDLNKFLCKVRNCVEIIKLLDQRCYLESPELFQTILGKLTPLLRSKWLDYCRLHFSTLGKTKLELLTQFLTQEVELQLKFGLVSDTPITLKKFEKVHTVTSLEGSLDSDPQESSTVLKIQSEVEPKPCVICKQTHDLSNCDKFVSMSVVDRWQVVKSNKLCHKCLKRGMHSYLKCKFTKEICKVSNCRARHHKLLHNETTTLPVNQVSTSVDDPPNELIAHTITPAEGHSETRSSFRPLLKIVAVTVTGPLGSVKTYALLDDGSTATFIDAQLSQHLGLLGPESQIKLDCVSGLGKTVRVQYVNFKIQGRSSEIYEIRNARSISNLGLSKQSTGDIKCFDYLQPIADVLCYENAHPKLIIGIDNWPLLISKEVRRGSMDQPVAIKTSLGWVLFGYDSNRNSDPIHRVNHVSISDKNDGELKQLNSLIQNYYRLDSLGITKKECLSDDDSKAVKILEETTRRLPDGKYEVGLPWKDNNFQVPDSFGQAISRFKSLERKMAKEPAYAEQYKLNMQAMFDKGYAEGPVSKECINKKCWFLPHFGVTNPNKPGKLRIVHDAAAKSNGVSLNSMLLTGPDLLNPILDILFRFREGKVGLSADIREMFPQIKIREVDRDAQRFLWRPSPKEPIQVYRMSSMIFGAASSPFSAQFIKNKNALEFKSIFPEAVNAILNDHYMDDCIVSTPSAENAAQLAADIVAVHKEAHYEMRSWVSNDPKALSLIPKELLLDPSLANVNVDLGKVAKSVRTLGLVWQPADDLLSFNTKGFVEKSSDQLTKREALSLMMSIYDPLGLLSPLTIRARILFQNVWRKSLDWDHQLSQDDIAAWKEWHNICVNSLNNLKIPRRYNLSDFGDASIERELHIFCDASESAYATVAYWRLIYPDGSNKVTLIGSKVRVAPLKPSSIPRLELQGALIAARFAFSIQEAHKFKPKQRFFWCDSMNVLGWIRSDARKFKAFVANRIGEIIELSEVSEWRWVPSEGNVADDATRLNKINFDVDSRWFTGPDFLISCNWPSEPSGSSPISEAQSELKPLHRLDRLVSHVININDSTILLPVSASAQRISKWLCLVRATALAHRFAGLLLKRCLDKRKTRGLDCNFDFLNKYDFLLSNPVLSAKNLDLAEKHVLWHSQLESFKEDYALLKNKKDLPRSSKLFHLSPVIGSDNVMRLSGRIKRAVNIPDDTKQPIILDGKHPTTRLLIMKYHNKAAHGNNEMVINEVRQSYWILGLRSTVRAVAHNCLVCRIRKAKPYNPPMGDLPGARLAYGHKPFSFVGLDYFGPLNVKIGRRQEKRYVALYTCLTCRAIHLEVVHSLSTDSALMSLRRFIARRGTPKEIYSDNGTAFVGLDRELKKLYSEEIQDFAANERISWKFIPPGAPFMGGAWERLIRCVKTALKVTLRSQSPQEEVLLTLLAEAEAIVNTRPLTHVPADPECTEALTPHHFLLGSSSGQPFVTCLTPFHLLNGSSAGPSFSATLSDHDLTSRSRWKIALRLADMFWGRWVREYLPNLLPRRSSTGSTVPKLKVGDIVLIGDSNLPRGTWPRGRVINLFPGRDNIVRVADVQTSNGILRRPLKKLVPICN